MLFKTNIEKYMTKTTLQRCSASLTHFSGVPRPCPCCCPWPPCVACRVGGIPHTGDGGDQRCPGPSARVLNQIKKNYFQIFKFFSAI